MQREHSLRELFNGLRYVVRYGIAWRAMPNDLPPWFTVYQQTQRWLAAGCFETLAQDLRAVLRLAAGRASEPTAAIIDSQTLRSTPESGQRAGYDGAKRKRGSKLHMAVDTLGHLLALHVTPANVDDRAEIGRLTDAIQEATGESRHPCLRRSGLHRRDGGRSCQAARHCVGSRQIAGGQTGFRAAAQAVGGRTVVRMGDPMQETGQGL